MKVGRGCILKQVNSVVGLVLVAGLFGTTACTPKEKPACTMPPLVGYVVPEKKYTRFKKEPQKTSKKLSKLPE